MGLRQAELSWAAREQLDLYARNKAKLIALDRWFEENPLVEADGKPAGPNAHLLAGLELVRSLAGRASGNDRSDGARRQEIRQGTFSARG